MACIACFIDNKNQLKIKNKCFGIDRFENKISKYKDLYIEELKQLKCISDCNCTYRNSNTQYKNWTNSFLKNMVDNVDFIINTFDQLKNIYIAYISEHNLSANVQLWNWMVTNELIESSNISLTNSSLLFRARINTNDFDSANINNFFHMPFDLRKHIPNQRFSISGQPMLYCSNSIIGVEKEVSKEIDSILVGGFLPKYNPSHKKTYFELKNSLFDVLTKSLPNLVTDGVSIDYMDNDVIPNYKSILKDLQKSILSQILTFPVESKSTFIEEYVLPQMLTTVLMEKGYHGIAFPSTKEFNNITCSHQFSDYEINIALFVNYSSSENYDFKLLESLIYFTLDGSENLNYAVEDIIKEFDSIRTKIKSIDSHNDLKIYLTTARLHIEYLEDSKINDIGYFDCKQGKLELEFFMTLADKINNIIK